MDYSLPAVKMLISQLKPAKEVARTGGPAFALGSLIFKRVWLQGLLVEGADRVSFLLDDGSGTLQLDMDFESWKSGLYVLVIGAYLRDDDGVPFVKVHKIVDLSSFHSRDKLWRLEVTEAHHLFYNK